MVNGYKQKAEDAETIPGSKPLAGVLFVGLIALFAGNLARHYDPTTQSLSLFGTQLQLGENEAQERRNAHEAHGEREEDEG